MSGLSSKLHVRGDQLGQLPHQARGGAGQVIQETEVPELLQTIVTISRISQYRFSRQLPDKT